jgi:hypothetical protein
MAIDRYSRIVFGFHGTTPDIAARLISGDLPLDQWILSTNVYDWLGHGIYFWEYAPERARVWRNKGGVVGAIINLGECFDLTDVKYTQLLGEAFPRFVQLQRRRKKQLPQNRGKRRELDCALINFAAKDIHRTTGKVTQSVRGAFFEGAPAFPGSAILRETHIQIAVRDPACIIGLFRPT